MVILSLMLIDELWMSVLPCKYFLHTVIDGKRIAPSSEVEVDMIVVISKYFSVAAIVCHKNMTNRIARKNVLISGPFFIFLDFVTTSCVSVNSSTEYLMCI